MDLKMARTMGFNKFIFFFTLLHKARHVELCTNIFFQDIEIHGYFKFSKDQALVLRKLFIPTDVHRLRGCVSDCSFD